MPSTIFAIDPSVASTGWACAEIGQSPSTGTVRFAKSGSSEDVVGAAALRWLSGKLAEFEPDVIAIEAPIRGSGNNTGFTNAGTIQLLFGLNMVLRTGILLKSGRPAMVIAPSSAAKALTGKGNYPKGERKAAVVAACVALGWAGTSDPDDIADACAIYAAAATRIDPSFGSNMTPLAVAMGAV